MQTVNNVFKWSVAISGTAVILMAAGVFALWLLIEMLAVLVGIIV